MPDLAMQRSAAGAKAFVRHYIDVLNYSWVALDSAGIRELSSNTCRICRRFARIIDTASAQGGYQHGGEWHVVRAYALPTTDIEERDVLVTVEIASGEWRRTRSDPIEPIKHTRTTDTFYLSWSGNAWRVQDVRAT
jgi:hypothetical protein